MVEGRDEQVAIGCGPLVGALHAPEKVHGLPVLKTYVLPPANRLSSAEDRVGGWRGEEKGRSRKQTPTPQAGPGSILVPTPQDGAQMACKAHTTTKFRCHIAWLTRCRKGGDDGRALGGNPKTLRSKDVDTSLWTIFPLQYMERQALGAFASGVAA